MSEGQVYQTGSMSLAGVNIPGPMSLPGVSLPGSMSLPGSGCVRGTGLPDGLGIPEGVGIPEGWRWVYQKGSVGIPEGIWRWTGVIEGITQVYQRGVGTGIPRGEYV